MTKEQTLKKIKMLITKYQRVISQTKNEHTDMILKDIEIDIFYDLIINDCSVRLY